MTLTDIPIGASILFQFVDHDQVPAHEADGWRNEGPSPAHHGTYSTVMTRIEE